MSLSTHVLDTARGRPAKGVPVTVEIFTEAGFRKLAEGRTNADGRIPALLGSGTMRKGLYRIVFNTSAYFRAAKVKSFFPMVAVNVSIADPKSHYHIPLLLSPFGYSTYRGS